MMDGWISNNGRRIKVLVDGVPPEPGFPALGLVPRSMG